VDRHSDGELVSKVGQLVFVLPALALVSDDACAADKIALTCSGTVSSKSKGYDKPFPSTALIIDLDQKKVTGALGEFSITESTERSIWFRGADGGGMIDRNSGHAIVREAFGTDRRSYELTCKPRL
jgi:hypothetical protein